MKFIVIILQLAIIFVAHFKETRALTGHVCYEQQTRYRSQIYYTSCGWWGRCTRYRAVTNYYRTQKCCSGWARNAYGECNTAICSPNCRNGGRCASPNRCICPSTHYGSYCQIARPCSSLHPCYPGTCPSRCSCTSGFKGSYCDDLVAGPQSPQFSSCNATLSNRLRGIDELTINVSCHLKNSDPSATTYVREQDLNHVQIQWSSRYDPSSPAIQNRPSYIRDVEFGIVAGKAEIKLTRKDKRQILAKSITCSNVDKRTSPSPISFCKVEHSFTRKFSHGDKLDITFFTKNGGFRQVYSSKDNKITTRYFNGVYKTETVEFVFDFEKPFHRGAVDSDLVVTVTEDSGQAKMELQWNNWLDDSGKIDRYQYSIFRGQSASKSNTPYSAVWRTGDKWPVWNIHQRGVTYTVELQVIDRAGNVGVKTKTVMVDAIIPTLPPNLCKNTVPCYPSGICPPDKDECICTEGFSGQGCSNTTVGPVIGHFEVILADTVSVVILNNTTKLKYSNKVDFKNLTINWSVTYDPLGDLPGKPSFVSRSKIGIEENNGKIVIKEQGKPSFEDIHDFSGSSCMNNNNPNNPFLGKAECSHVYINNKAKQHGDSLAVTLMAKSGGTVTFTNVDRKEYTENEVKTEIHVQFDTESPYHKCELSKSACEEDKLSLSLQAQGSRYILLISWKFWTDDLSGIDRYEYSIYHSDGTDNITEHSVSVYNATWEEDNDTSPTYNIEEDDLKNAYTIRLKIVDRAENFVAVTRDIDVQSALLKMTAIEDEISKAGGVFLILFIILVVVVVALVTGFLIHRRRQIKAGEESDYQPHVFKRVKSRLQQESWYGTAFSFTNKAYKEPNHDNEDDELYVYDNRAVCGTDKVVPNSIALQEVLVNGRFATITKAEWAPKKNEVPKVVVAKMLKDGQNQHDKKLMQAKIKFLANIPRHGNVVAFLGKITTDEEHGPYMLLEYCELGTLRDWLASNLQGREVSADTHDNLVGFCLQIARGMRHLADNKVVHGSLMAKNVLVSSKLIAKVTGFGPRNEEQEKARLPTKWLAIEVLHDPNLTKTTKSDVWAYGICVWEIFSLGQLPYNKPGHSGQKAEMISLLESGYRMEQPEECPDQIYGNIMMTSWRRDPSERPSFSDIESELDKVFHPPPSEENMYYE